MISNLTSAAILAGITTLIGVPICIWMAPDHMPLSRWVWFALAFYAFSFLLQIAIYAARAKGWLP